MNLCALLLAGQLMAPDDDAAMRELLPALADPAAAAVLRSPRLVLYTRAEIAPAVQSSNGVHSARYRLGPDRRGLFANSFEHPWQEPAGTDTAADVFVLRGFLLPLRGDGRPWPVAVWRETQRTAPRDDSRFARLSWTFPAGTVFVELLCRREGGWVAPFRLNMRTKTNDAAGSVDAFRPHETWRELRDDLAARGLDALAAQLDRPMAAGVRISSKHPVKSVEASGVVEVIDAYPIELAAAMAMQRPWPSVLGAHWRRTPAGVVVDAPAGGIHPRNWRGIFEIDSRSCARCHQSAGRSVAFFDLGRDWYGSVRGDDHILSWHPFDASCIGGDGFSRGFVVSRAMAAAGLVAVVGDPRTLPPAVYFHTRER